LGLRCLPSRGAFCALRAPHSCRLSSGLHDLPYHGARAIAVLLRGGAQQPGVRAAYLLLGVGETLFIARFTCSAAFSAGRAANRVDGNAGLAFCAGRACDALHRALPARAVPRCLRFILITAHRFACMPPPSHLLPAAVLPPDAYLNAAFGALLPDVARLSGTSITASGRRLVRFIALRAAVDKRWRWQHSRQTYLCVTRIR